jgi:hypothetical protein
VSNLRIVPYNDHDDCTLSVNVTLPDGFEAENTQNTRRGDVLRTTDTTTLVITGVAPANRVANCFFLFRHLLAGASVRLQLFTDTGASVAATGGDSGTNAALWYTASEPYVWSTGTNDPFVSEAPYRYYYASDVTWRSFKLTVSGTPSAVSYYQIGRIVIGRYKELAVNPGFGLQIGYKDLSRSNRTDGASLRAWVGGQYRTIDCNLNSISSDEHATWLQIQRQVGTAKDIVVDCFPDDTTSLGRDHLMNCAMTSLNAIGHEVSRFTQRLQFQEC